MEKPKNHLYQKYHDYLVTYFDLPFQIIECLQDIKADKDFDLCFTQYNRHLHECLLQAVKNPKRDILKETNSTTSNIEEYINTFPENTTETQLSQRYYSQPGDIWHIRLKKIFKRLRLFFKKRCIALGNVFRKNKKQFTFHKHNIPEKRLARYVFLNNYTQKATPFIVDTLNNRRDIVLQLYALHESLLNIFLKNEEFDRISTLNSIIAIEKKFQEELKKIATFFDACEKNAHDNYAKYRKLCGTTEFPNRKIKPWKLRRLQKKYLKKLFKKIKRRELHNHPVFEFWKVKTGSGIYLWQLKESVKKLLDIFKSDTEKTVLKELEAITAELNTCIGDLENATIKEDKEHALLKIKEQISRKAPVLNQKIIDLNAESYINQLIDQSKKAAATFPENILFYKAHDSSKKYRAALAKTIQPAELFSGMLQKKANKWLQDEKKALLKKNQQVYQNIDEIVNALEYAYEYFSNHQDNTNEETKTELLKGLKRSQNRSEENIKIIGALHQLCSNSFSSYIEKNTEAVCKISDPEWVAKSSRIWRHKKRSDLWAEKIKTLSLKTWPRIKTGFAKTLDFYKLTRRKYFNLRSILGIAVEKESISSELSNYLANTAYAINRLPLMYQRLFVNIPLKENRFYTHRNTLEKQLKIAYSNWQKKGYAPSCIIGENGCGKTTLLNVFIDQKIKECEVVRINLEQKHITEESFVSLLKTYFPKLEFNTLDQFSTNMNAISNPRIVILENIHHLFLRKHQGQEMLLALLNLISFSNRNIFWLTTCNLYAWKFFNYAYSISDYFGHIIEFNFLRKETITNAISIRHKPSGFDMRFMEPENIKLKRQYTKLNEEGKQEFLKNHFFEQLHQSVQGNLSLAFLLWLRSVEKIEENALYFKFKKINPSFLNNLGVQKISSLYAILIHSGLSAEEHSMVFPMPLSQSKNQLMIMANDAILIKNKNTYTINPLLYRSIVNYLQSANYIH